MPEHDTDILISGGWRGVYGHAPGLAAARTRVAAVALAAALITLAAWTGRAELAGAWRYWAEHQRPLPPGVLCPTFAERPAPGPGLLASTSYLGHDVPPAVVARDYGCIKAALIYNPPATYPLPAAGRIK